MPVAGVVVLVTGRASAAVMAQELVMVAALLPGRRMTVKQLPSIIRQAISTSLWVSKLNKGFLL